MTKPCTPIDGSPAAPLRRGGQVAHAAADADQPGARPRQPRRVLRARARRGRAAPRAAWAWPAPCRCRKRSVMRTAPRGHEPGFALEPAVDAHELQRAAAEVEHAAVGERRRVDRGQVAVARLLLAAEHADRQAGPRAGTGEEGRRVAGVANRARRDAVHGAPRRGRWPGRNGRTRRWWPAPLDRLLSELAARREPLADPHGLDRSRRFASTSRLARVNTTSRKEFDPRSITARRSGASEASVGESRGPAIVTERGTHVSLSRGSPGFAGDVDRPSAPIRQDLLMTPARGGVRTRRCVRLGS